MEIRLNQNNQADVLFQCRYGKLQNVCFSAEHLKEKEDFSEMTDA